MPRLRGRWRYMVVVGLVAVAAATAASSSSGAGNPSLGASQGVTAKTITFGFSSGLAGAFALAGGQEQSGILAAFAEANASGGIQGRKLKLVSLNDNFDPTLEVTNYRSLAEQSKVYGIVGSVLIAPAGVYQLAAQEGTPTFPLFAYPDPKLANVFLLGSTLTAQSVGTVPVLAHLFKGKSVKVGIISGASSAAAVSAAKDLMGQFSNLNLVSTQANVPFTATDMTPYVLAAKSAGAQAMLMFTGSTQNYLFMQAADQQNFKPLYIGNGGTMAASGMLGLASCSNNCYRVTEYSPTSAGYANFSKWVAKTGVAPSDQGAEEFAITETMIQILRLSGHDLSWKHFEFVAEHAMKNFSTGGLYHKLTFGPGVHLGSPYTITEKISGGKWVSLGGFVREPKQYDSGP